MTGNWRDSAACAGHTDDLFFPTTPGIPYAAKRICMACPVRTECLTWAMDNPVEGVWGGTTLAERRNRSAEPYDTTYSQAGARTAQLARYHADGLNDREIGVRMGMHQDTVGRVRRGLGLPANAGVAS